MRKPINGYKPKTLDIGLMKKEVLIQEQALIEDEGGGYAEGWKDYKTTWTFPETITNEWLLRMGQKSTGDNKYFLIRHDTQINKSMRIKYKNLSYRIINYDSFNDGEWFMKLECVGNENDG